MTESEKVWQSLRNGDETANQIRAHTGLPHEAVYTELAKLEAKGVAGVLCSKPNRGPVEVTWRALS